ncbi:MAG TPA: hypothetical protein VK809_09170 [Bacteroidia bacterium]|jgi:hypothetical protein|nr:hypothetical protein [Bacteroidia bacterium]
METNSDSENGNSQNDGAQTNSTNGSDQSAAKEQTKEAGPKTMFLEYTTWREGQHNISAIIKDSGEKRGIVAARIYTEFPGDGKPPTYSAKDKDGNILFPPTQKLWELKKDIKEQARPLLEKARLAKNSPAIGKPEQKKEEPIVQKEAKAIGNKIADEGMQFAGQTKDIITGTRSHEINRIRNKKVQKNKGRSR